MVKKNWYLTLFIIGNMYMNDFSQEISDFQKNGTYNYEFDEGGNLIFNKFSSDFNQHYISIPLVNFGYDKSKITSFYDLEFKEFVPTTIETKPIAIISPEITQLTQENLELKDKLTELTASSDTNITDSERLAMKQIIIGLRINLKEGVADRDFSDVFPYLPIKKNKK